MALLLSRGHPLASAPLTDSAAPAATPLGALPGDSPGLRGFPGREALNLGPSLDAWPPDPQPSPSTIRLGEVLGQTPGEGSRMLTK